MKNLHEAYYYSGDINIIHGGLFVNPDYQDYQNGYMEAYRVSPCEESPVYYLENLTVIIDKERIKQAMDCMGYTPKDILAAPSDDRRLLIGESLVGYGHYDPADCGYDHYLKIAALEDDKDEIPEHVQVDIWMKDISELEEIATRAITTNFVR